MIKFGPRLMAAVSIAALGVHGAPAFAQDQIDPQIERLIEAAATPQAALAEARDQQAAGDLLGAASTLERALIEHPAADDVRLAYATVLCLLDDPASAGSELQVLRGRPTKSAQWHAMEEACGTALPRTSRRTGRVSGRITAGAAYDSNAADALSSYPIYGLSSRDGLAFVASAEVNARLPVGSAFFYGNGFVMTHDDQSGPANDYQYGEASLGLGKEGEKVEIAGGAVVRHGRVLGASYVTVYGGQASIAIRSGRSGRLKATAEVTREDYYDGYSNGTHYDLLAGYEYDSATQRRFYIAAGIERKTSRSPDLSYTGARLVGWMQVPLGEHGVYASASGTAHYLKFDQPYPYYSRRDLRFYGRVAVGVPILARTLFLEPAATIRYRHYNAGSYLPDYTSEGAELRLVWKF